MPLSNLVFCNCVYLLLPYPNYLNLASISSVCYTYIRAGPVLQPVKHPLTRRSTQHKQLSTSPSYLTHLYIHNGSCERPILLETLLNSSPHGRRSQSCRPRNTNHTCPVCPLPSLASKLQLTPPRTSWLSRERRKRKRSIIYGFIIFFAVVFAVAASVIVWWLAKNNWLQPGPDETP
jgi:hypothetical protein